MLWMWLIGLAAIWLVWQTRPKARARRLYFAAKHRYVSPFSDWFDPLFGFFATSALYDNFDNYIDGVREVLEIREADVSRLYEVAIHVLKECPYEASTGNAWYAVHTARRDYRVLDDDFMPLVV